MTEPDPGIGSADSRGSTEVIWWAVGLLAVVLAMLVSGFDVTVSSVATVAFLMLILTLRVGNAMANPIDGVWLPQLVAWAFLVKLLGSGVRYYVLVDEYSGAGDAVAYHERASSMARAWRALTVPVSEGLDAGTRFVDVVTSLIYTPWIPPMLGGFFIFATLAFLGQLALYAAFRRVMPPKAWRTYAILVLLLPSLVFWPSSIGKESLMLLFIGLAALGIAGIYKRFNVGSLFVAAVGLSGMAAVRPHVAALLVAAAVLGGILARPSPRPVGSGWRRLLMVVVLLASFVVLVQFGSSYFDIEDPQEIDEFVADVSRNTAQGGSEVSGSAVGRIADIPSATLRVLFRPFPTEAHNLQALLSSVEGVLLMGLMLWKLPHIWRTMRSTRRHPYLAFSGAFTLGFVVAFSPILNLGILARQRVQVLPFLLVLVVGHGWTSRRSHGDAELTEDLQAVQSSSRRPPP